MDRRFFVSVAVMAAAVAAAADLAPGMGVREARAQQPAPQMTVVARGLDNPRGLAFGPDRALYVAEAGRGGSGPCLQGPDGAQCLGATGAVTRVQGGVQQRILTGLPSLAGENGVAATGPHDVAFDSKGGVSVVIGLGNDPAVRNPGGPLAGPGSLLGTLLRFPAPARGAIVDIAGYEAAANPDGRNVESNPYSVAPRNRSMDLVADAGANALFRVNPAGHVETAAVFPVRLVPAPPFPGLPPQIPMDPVPTAVAVSPRGEIYVGELTGFPFPRNGARIYRVVEGSTQPQVYLTGFTNIIDLAFGRDGSLYVLEHTRNGLLSGDPTGALIRVAPGGGARTVVASAGLIFPTGLAVGPDGALYVSNNGIFAGTGEVVRIVP